ncbi:MAG: hypothetical protein NT027_02685 [Proteobacteria bacterium]|nr:hypothetical protein [Pseudomonadota bacterium]
MSEQSQNQNLKFAVMGVSILLATLMFFSGAFWIKSLYDRVDELRIADFGQSISANISRIALELQSDIRKAKYLTRSGATDFSKNPRSAVKSIQEFGLDLYRFDYVSWYDSDRKLIVEMMRDLATPSGELQITQKAQMGLNKDARILDLAEQQGMTSGIVQIDSRPISLMFRHFKNGQRSQGTLILGRALAKNELASWANLPESTISLFDLSQPTEVPKDVLASQLMMKGDRTFYGKLERRGGGVGYLRLDDVEKRPAFVLRYPWIERANTGERKELAWLFVGTLVFGGIVHLSSIAAIGRLQANRRKNPGLAGLSLSEFREFVESFPGYAFAIDESDQYLGVSRGLCGRMGKEAPEIAFSKFGQFGIESGLDVVQLRTRFLEGSEWPAVQSVSIQINGISGRWDFEGTGHWIASRKIILVIVQLQSEPKSSSIGKLVAFANKDSDKLQLENDHKIAN